MKVFIISVMLFFLSIFAGAGYSVIYWWATPTTLQNTVTYEVKEGKTLTSVLTDLEKINVVRWPLFYRIYARYTDQGGKIKTGIYDFESNELPADIMEKLLKGKNAYVKFAIIEGLNMYQVAEKLTNVFPKFAYAEWLQEMQNTELLSELIVEAKNLEGFLFPQTYVIRPNADKREVIGMLIKEFKKNFSPDIINQGNKIGLSPYKIVILASIIEKETGNPAERKQISAVFHNRLRLKMRLQTDPTVIYGMWEHYDGNIRKKDLQTETPYNTYMISGLPPGPIANPGADALKAAVTPDISNYLYFVSRGDGSHYFSSNLTEHNQAVYKYQIKK